MPKTFKVPYMRLRMKDKSTTGRPVYESASGPVANWNTLIGYTPGMGEIVTMTDKVTPGFEKIKSEGGLVFSPMSMQKLSAKEESSGPDLVQTAPANAVGQKYSFGSGFLSYKLDGQESPSKVIRLPKQLASPVVDRSIQEACTQAQRVPSLANVLVTAAEYKETLRLVPGILKDWSRLFGRLNSVPIRTLTSRNVLGNLRHNYAEYDRAITNLWLATRYGVRPLVMETLGIMKALKTIEDEGVARHTQRGFSQTSLGETEYFDVTYGVTSHSIVGSHHSDFSVRAMNVWEMKMDFAQNIGLSFTSVPEAMIDLVRFSFVLNWIVNVNDFFSSLSASIDPGMRSAGGCYTVSLTRTSVYQIASSTCTAPATYSLTKQASGIYAKTERSKYRVVGLSPPKLVVRGDPGKFLHDLRLLDAVALLRLQTRGRGVQRLNALSKSGLV